MREGNVVTTGERTAKGRFGRVWRNEYLWAALLLGAMTALFFNPVFLHHGSFSAVYAHQRGTYPWVKPGDPPVFTLHDQADYVYPRQVFLDRSLKQDHQIPLWDPLTFAGHPFFAETGSRIAYPPFFLLTLLFSPILMHDVYLMVHVFGAGLAMFALMRELRTRFGGSLLAAVAWAFGSYALLYYVLEMYAGVAALLPLAALFVHRWHEKKSWRSLLTASLVLGLLYLGTSAELALLAFLAIACYAGCLALGDLARERETLDLSGAARTLAAPLVLVAAAVAVAAVGILPFIDLSARSGRTVMSYRDIMKYFPHAHVTDFARTFSSPEVPLTRLGVSQQVFLGTATVLLALVGFVSRRPGAGLSRGLVVVIFAVAVGGPGTWLAYHLPAINKLHGVGRAFFLFNLGMAVLGGIGLDRLLGWVRYRAPESPTTAIGDPGDPPIRRAGSVGRNALVLGITAVCVVTAFGQLFSYGRGIHPPFQRRDPMFLLPPTGATEAARAVLTSTPGGGRVLPIIRLSVEPAVGYTLPAATGMALNLPITGGYEPVLPEQAANMWRLLAGEKLTAVLHSPLNDTALNAGTVGGVARTDLLARYGVSAVLGPPTMAEQAGWEPTNATRMGLRMTYSGTDGVVYEVINRSPRAYFVYDAAWSASPDEALARFESPGFDARREVILDAKQAGDFRPVAAAPERTAPPAQVRWVDNKPNGMVLGVDAPAAGWLVVLDSWDPGWKATVDGRSTRVLKANYGFRAVRLDAGRSTVRFDYRPTSVTIGAWISGISVTAILAFVAVVPALRRWNRRRPRGTGDDAVASG